MDTLPYRSFNEYARQRFGCKVYKLSVDAGMTCPNRDGKVGYGGCIFCDGSGAFAQKSTSDLLTEMDQILQQAKAKVEAKNKDGKYIVYFQSFTNTYAPVEKLRMLFEKAISYPDVVAISIGTRPDCLEKEVLDLLEELNTIKPVWIELGLQTIHEETARYIRRGYPLSVFDEAVHNLKTRGIETIVHMIAGLPGEDADKIVETARYIGKSGADGIKIHLLHVLQNTDLAEEYHQGHVPMMEMEEYFSILGRCLQVLPKDLVIHRLTGDGAKKDLIAPLWTANKKKVLNSMKHFFTDQEIHQGDSFYLIS